MNTPITYTFYPITHCNMCGSGSARHKILGKRLNQSQGRHPDRKTGITTTIMRCKDCGLIFSNPMPVPVNMQDHYGVEAEAYWQPEYLKTPAFAYKKELEKIKKIIGDDVKIKSLDIGAGFGVYMKACEDAGFDAYGCEPSEPFYKMAIEKMNISPDHLMLSSVENLSWPDETFHFISMGAVLEHLADPAMALKRCMKMLKTEGVINIIVPSSDWLTAKLFDHYYKLTCKKYTNHLSPMHSPFHLFEFSLKSFDALSNEAGFRIIEHDYDVCQTYLPRGIDFVAKAHMHKFNKGMELRVSLQKGHPKK